MAEVKEGVIKEGFICPICHRDLRSPKNLIGHFEETHSEEQDVLTSLKELFGKAKNKILKLDEKDIESLKTDFSFQKYFIGESIPQDPGQSRSHMDYFRDVRRERVDHRTSETNKLIIRLDRLLRAEGSDRKQIAQELVPWLDGTTVTRCPSCTASFNLTRRQHHCRLGGCIMCNSCSAFITHEEARRILKPIYSDVKESGQKDDSETLRICLHCKNMLDCRRYIQMFQNAQPVICQLYDRLKVVRSEIETSVELYQKMYSSIISGDTLYQLQDAQAVKQSIAKQAEVLDAISKRIVAIPQDPEFPKTLALQTAIRKSVMIYIKDNLMALPILPTPVELERIRKSIYFQNVEVPHAVNVSVKKVAVTTGWSPANMPTESSSIASDDPIMEQINIVRNYIEQAKKAQRFDEVMSLKENLRMLKEMYSKQQHQLK